MKLPSILLTLILTLMLAHSSLADTAVAKVYVVKFHADWCGSCRVLGPVIAKARGKAGLDDTEALFVKLDLTNATSRNQSELMASALGLGDFYEENAGKTGFALLVDAESGEIKGRITKDMNANDVIGSIEQLL